MIIEISKRNGNWEVSQGGGLLCYNDDLRGLLGELLSLSDEIESQYKEDYNG